MMVNVNIPDFTGMTPTQVYLSHTECTSHPGWPEALPSLHNHKQLPTAIEIHLIYPYTSPPTSGSNLIYIYDAVR